MVQRRHSENRTKSWTLHALQFWTSLIQNYTKKCLSDYSSFMVLTVGMGRVSVASVLRSNPKWAGNLSHKSNQNFRYMHVIRDEYMYLDFRENLKTEIADLWPLSFATKLCLWFNLEYLFQLPQILYLSCQNTGVSLFNGWNLIHRPESESYRSLADQSTQRLNSYKYMLSQDIPVRYLAVHTCILYGGVQFGKLSLQRNSQIFLFSFRWVLKYGTSSAVNLWSPPEVGSR